MKERDRESESERERERERERENNQTLPNQKKNTQLDAFVNHINKDSSITELINIINNSIHCPLSNIWINVYKSGHGRQPKR